MGDEHTTAAAGGQESPAAPRPPLAEPGSPAAAPGSAPGVGDSAAAEPDAQPQPNGGGPGTAGEPPAPDVGELTARAAERDEYLARAQRTRADFDNYRKRVARDAAAAESRAIGRLVRELLPAIDNLERALAAASADPAGHLAGGMRMVRDDLVGALARAGVESYTPQGEPFDPELHEAIAQHVVAGAAPGTVVEVYQAGYRLNGSLIRPARVVVAGAPAEPAPAPVDGGGGPAGDDGGAGA
jgi:molecular chaperone GrpE